jgi:hypothetical protein
MFPLPHIPIVQRRQVDARRDIVRDLGCRLTPRHKPRLARADQRQGKLPLRLPVAGHHGGGTAVECGNHVRSVPHPLQESPSGQELYPTPTRSHEELGDATTPIDQMCSPQDSRIDSEDQRKYNARVRNQVRRALWNRRMSGSLSSTV